VEIIFIILFYKISVITGKKSISEPIKDNIVMRARLAAEMIKNDCIFSS